MGGCKCSVKDCNVASDGRTHFFHYPVFDKKRCLQWIYNAKRSDFISLTVAQLRNKVICENHFPNHMFMNELKNKLKKEAIPMDAGAEHKELSKELYINFVREQKSLPIDVKKHVLHMKYGDFVEGQVDNLNEVNRIKVEYALDQMCDDALRKTYPPKSLNQHLVNIENKESTSTEPVQKKEDLYYLQKGENIKKKINIVSLECNPNLKYVIGKPLKPVNPQSHILGPKVNSKKSVEIMKQDKDINHYLNENIANNIISCDKMSYSPLNKQHAVTELNETKSEQVSNSQIQTKKQNTVYERASKRNRRSFLKENLDEKVEITIEAPINSTYANQKEAENQNTLPYSKPELKELLKEVLAESPLAKKIDHNMSELEKIKQAMKSQEVSSKSTVGTQTLCKEPIYKKYLFHEISKFLSSKTKDILYKELFLDIESPVPLKKRRCAKSGYK